MSPAVVSTCVGTSAVSSCSYCASGCAYATLPWHAPHKASEIARCAYANVKWSRRVHCDVSCNCYRWQRAGSNRIYIILICLTPLHNWLTSNIKHVWRLQYRANYEPQLPIVGCFSVIRHHNTHTAWFNMTLDVKLEQRQKLMHMHCCSD